MYPVEPVNRHPSIGPIGVFLPSNVNNGKVTQICNIILVIVLILSIVAAIVLGVYAIMGWINRVVPEEVTTLNPQGESKVTVLLS